MRTDSNRNLSAEADPNPARKTRERVLTVMITVEESLGNRRFFFVNDNMKSECRRTICFGEEKESLFLKNGTGTDSLK